MVKRSLLVLAAGLVMAATMLAVQQVAILFLVVTVGGPGLHAAGTLFGRTFLGLGAIMITAGCALPCLVLVVRHVGALRGKEGLLLVAALGLLELLSLSYRFPSVLVAGGGMWMAWHKSRRAWFVLALAAVLALSPADVSVRVRPQGFRWAEAIAGDLAHTPAEFDALGDRVWVGDGLLFNQPRWVWVW